MHIITHKRLTEFALLHPDLDSALDHWYRLMKTHTFQNFAELREVFPSADQVKNLTVFNIGGNKARLIAAIRYKGQVVYIRGILTHAEYDQEKWKE